MTPAKKPMARVAARPGLLSRELDESSAHVLAVEWAKVPADKGKSGGITLNGARHGNSQADDVKWSIPVLQVQRRVVGQPRPGVG